MLVALRPLFFLDALLPLSVGGSEAPFFSTHFYLLVLVAQRLLFLDALLPLSVGGSQAPFFSTHFYLLVLVAQRLLFSRRTSTS